MYSAHGVQKRRVLRCFVPFAVPEFHLGAIKKPRVLRGFGGHGVPRNGKNDMSKVFGPSSGKFVATMGRHRAKIGPT